MKKEKKSSSKYELNLYDCQYNAVLKAVNSMFFHDESKSKFWMICTNPLLGNVSPVSMLKAGRFSKLMKIIYTNLGENFLIK